MRAGAEGGHIRDYLRNDRSIARMHARRRESARLVARLQACMPAQSPPRLSQRLWSVAGAWYAAPFYLPSFSFSLSLLPSSFLSFFRSLATTNKQTKGFRVCVLFTAGWNGFYIFRAFIFCSCGA